LKEFEVKVRVTVKDPDAGVTLARTFDMGIVEGGGINDGALVINSLAVAQDDFLATMRKEAEQSKLEA
jgi:hypothetical protein